MATTPDSFWFDDIRLQALETEEKKELLLFQWLSTLEKDLNNFGISNQKHIESLLNKYILSSSPKPNRPTRNLIARCFNIIYTKGDSRSLFDTIVGILNALSKKLDVNEAKIAGIAVLGAITQNHGEKVLSLFSESVAIILKFLRYAKDAEVTLKFECISALTSSIRGAGRTANDQLSKDLYKLAKNGLSDRILLLRTAYFELLEAVYRFTIYPPPLNLSEFEISLNLCVKAVDSRKSNLRNASASCVAALLSLSQKPPPVQKNSIVKAADDQNILSVEEMLSLLQTCYIKASSIDSKMAYVEGWAVFFRSIGIGFVENNYSLISDACFTLASNLKLQKDKSDAYVVKEASLYLIRDIVGKRISESGQLRACRDLVKSLSSETHLPDAKTAGILATVTALMVDLGPAAFSIQDDIVDPLLSLIGHPSPKVKLELAAVLREVCIALPHKITKIMNRLVVIIQRELPQMTADKPETVERVVGYGHILSSVIGIISSRSLFAAYEDAATIFGLATQLLKTHLNAKDYRIMASQAQIGWTLVGSLMTLGHNFVRVHVSQLLLIWKNVFPKTQSKDSSMNRGELEWHYLLVARESALAALESFITFNGKELVSADVAKRIMISLNNTLQFASTLVGAYGPVDERPLTPFQSRLYERECRLKCRLFACFKLLSPVSVYENIFTPLIRAVVDSFALDPEKPDRFLAILGTKEGALFGTIGGKDTGALLVETITSTSLISGSVITVADDSGAEEKSIFRKSHHDTQLEKLDDVVSRKEQRSFEYDPQVLYLTSKVESTDTRSGTETFISQLVPSVHSTVALTDSAIELFSLIFPLQNAQTQETVMEQLIKAATYQGGRVTPIRKFASQINTLIAVIGALKYVAGKKGQLQSQKVSVAIRDLMSFFVKSPDAGLRSAACEIAGRVARINGNAMFINPMIQDFIDLVVNNRDPDARAGACLAMGSIFHFVGGMAVGSHLRNCVGIFTTLAADSHPHVHLWALHSLYLTIDSSGLSYGPFVNATLSLLSKLCMSSSHEPSAAAAVLPSVDSESEVYPEFGRILYSLLGVLGPELQDSSKLRDMCFNLFEQLKNDLDPLVVVEAIHCIQNFIMFAPKHVDIPVIIPFLQSQLTTGSKSHDSIVRNAAVTCLYQLTQRDPGSVLGAAIGNCLEEQLFSLLDLEIDPSVRDEIKDILLALLRHVSPTKPSRWIDLCRSILAKSMPQDPHTNMMERKEDDGDDGEAAPVPTAKQKMSSPPLLITLLPRWRTQVFSLSCLELVIKVAVASGRLEDFNLILARKKRLLSGDANTDFLVFRTGDLIRLAFNASTGSVTFLKLSGLKLLHVILENFAPISDPEYENHRLLEQYEAQIISALAPGFDVDSAPEITSEGCKVTSHFLCCGILTKLDENFRPVKLLISLLEQFVGPEPKTNGRAPNAQIVVKLSVLSAWAILFSKIGISMRASLFSSDLLASVFTLWIQTLKEFSLLGDEADEVNTVDLGPISALYGTASKFVTLPYFNAVWIDILRAVTEVIDENFPASFNSFPDHSHNLDSQIDPPTSFFNLLGLCVEFLSKCNGKSVKSSSDIDKVVICITVIKKLTTKRVLGNNELPQELLMELLSIFDKLSQTEDVFVQAAIMECMNHFVVQFGESNFEDAHGNLKEHHYRILRIIHLGLANFIPGLTANPNAKSNQCFDDVVSISKALSMETISIISQSLQQFQSLLEYGLLGVAAKRYISCFVLTVTCCIASITVVILDDQRLSVVIPNFLAAFKSALQQADNATFVRASLDVILSKLKICWLIKSFNTSVNLKNEDSLVFKNLTLALVLTLSIFPKSYHYSVQKSVDKCLAEIFCCSEVSMDVRITCLQSMRALMLLSTYSDAEVSSLGDVYVRLFLPTITQQLLSDCKLLLSEPAYYDLVEEELKTFLILSASYSNEQMNYQVSNLTIMVFLQVAETMEGCITQNCLNISEIIGGTFLQLASKSQLIFRSVLQNLSDQQRQTLESGMKFFVNSKSQPNPYPSGGNTEEFDAPKIHLKKFGE